MITTQNTTLHIQETIKQSISNREHLLVAFSGGVDSTVLLHALVQLKQICYPKLSLKAIYIHHGLSLHADAWAKHCKVQCELWQVPFIMEKVVLDNKESNIEEQARNARYSAIYSHLQKNEILCTAQHLDDQCETFFLALKRGSGPAGLAAMPKETSRLLRPLLPISRQQIEAYAREQNLVWIEDESNQDDHYDRNFLRLTVLPTLNQRWPHFSQMVARSAELCQQQEQLLAEILTDDLNRSLSKEGQLDINVLNDFSNYKRNAILRMWFKSFNINMPTRQQLELIWQTVAQAKEDANPTFVLNDKQIRRYQHQLYLLPQYQNIEHNVLIWDLSIPLILPDNLGLLQANDLSINTCRLPKADEHVTVRFHAQGHFQIVGRQGSRAIKKLWQECQIAPWMRTRTPLIYYNDELITAVGVFTTKQGQGTDVSFTIM